VLVEQAVDLVAGEAKVAVPRADVRALVLVARLDIARLVGRAHFRNVCHKNRLALEGQDLHVGTHGRLKGLRARLHKRVLDALDVKVVQRSKAVLLGYSADDVTARTV
jgi:hypothetical protein